MESFIPWMALIIPSAVTGALCAYFIHSKNGIFLAGGLPFLGFALFLLILNLTDSDDSGFAWVFIVLMIAGITAAITGLAAYVAMFHAILSGRIERRK